MENPSDQVRLYLPRIVAEWSQVAIGPPWAGLTEPQRIDFLPPLMTATLRATICEPPIPAARSEAIRAAAEHGGERRAQGFTEQDVVLEYYLIRLALWTATRAAAPVPLRPLAGARADALLSVLALVTLHAYADEGGGGVPDRWLGALDALLGEPR
ncbi:MAG TPA: hypothetical protein VM076_19285 [Gemmatimonadaceae bacterium]|nr:hypothetical protein [Gemmatimonadaceae bacterium]